MFSKPWLTPQTCNLIKRKNKIYSKVWNKKDSQDYAIYKQYRNQVSRFIKDAKRDFSEKTIIKNTKDSKVLRQNVKTRINVKGTTKQCPQKVASTNAEILMKPLNIAAEFNSYFSGTNILPSLPGRSKGELEFLDVNHCITTDDDFGFVTKDFVKPIAEGRQFINGNSHHPKSTFKSILFGEAIQLRRLNHGRRKDFFQGESVGDFPKIFSRGSKSGEICFLPLEIEKTTFLC